MFRHIFTSLAIALVLSFTHSAVQASAQRTFVSSTGSDSNPCSLVQPCRSFARAITQTNANGEILVLDSAGYGPVMIGKSVSIIAPPGVYAGISVLSGDGITVNAGASDTVVLRGLSVNGQGGSVGINFVQGGRVHVESCVISNMGAAGIVLSAAHASLSVLDTIVRGNAAGFSVVADGSSVLLDRVRVEGNSGEGLYIAPTPGSLGVVATISDSVFADNGGNGVNGETVGNATTSIQVERSVLSHNIGSGFRSFAGAAPGAAVVATLSRNTISDNSHDQVQIIGASPGVARLTAYENAAALNVESLFVGIRANGSGAIVYAGANGGRVLACANNGTLYSAGNNLVEGLGTDGTCSPVTVAPK